MPAFRNLTHHRGRRGGSTGVTGSDVEVDSVLLKSISGSHGRLTGRLPDGKTRQTYGLPALSRKTVAQK
ncbi:MAG: hypothetical protein IT444_00750 [Phycisphaeraceae bacterium]|nr:hypothetical protein [Phycisphaeraceae bacterium]